MIVQDHLTKDSKEYFQFQKQMGLIFQDKNRSNLFEFNSQQKPKAKMNNILKDILKEKTKKENFIDLHKSNHCKELQSSKYLFID